MLYLFRYIMMKYLAEQKTYREPQIHQVKWIKVVVKRKGTHKNSFQKESKSHQQSWMEAIEFNFPNRNLVKTFDWSIFSVILGIYFLCFHIYKNFLEYQGLWNFTPEMESKHVLFRIYPNDLYWRDLQYQKYIS